MFTAVGVDNIGGPLLRLSVEEAGGVNLRPNGTLTVEAVGIRRSFRDVNLHGTFVSTRDRIFTGALIVLVPFKGDLYTVNETGGSW